MVQQTEEKKKNDLPILLLFGLGLSGLFWALTRTRKVPANLSGTVTNYYDAPLVGIIVTVGNKTATTDANGFYSLRGFTAGDYTGECHDSMEFSPYLPQDITVHLPPGDSTLDIQMELIGGD